MESSSGDGQLLQKRLNNRPGYVSHSVSRGPETQASINVDLCAGMLSPDTWLARDSPPSGLVASPLRCN